MMYQYYVVIVLSLRLLKDLACDTNMVELHLKYVVVLWLAVLMSVKWKDDYILIRLGSELWLAVDRTPHSPRRTLHVGFATPLIALFQFPYDNEKLLRK